MYGARLMSYSHGTLMPMLFTKTSLRIYVKSHNDLTEFTSNDKMPINRRQGVNFDKLHFSISNTCYWYNAVPKTEKVMSLECHQ